MTIILKIVFVVYLVMNVVRLGIVLHGKNLKNNILKEKELRTRLEFFSPIALNALLLCFLFIFMNSQTSIDIKFLCYSFMLREFFAFI